MTRCAGKDIVDTAVEAGSFKTLASALESAGLVSALKGKGPFTVFAPTDAAFEKLPKGTVEALLKDIPKLYDILTYHVIQGEVMAATVVTMNGASAKTINGLSVTVNVNGGSVMINDANVVTTDIKASNGVIHVIDSVLLPPKAKKYRISGSKLSINAESPAMLKGRMKLEGKQRVFVQE
jgi:uncharacterized surface protein with fasciclin (FAS1) repeats